IAGSGHSVYVFRPHMWSLDSYFRPSRSRLTVFDLHDLDSRYSTSAVSTLSFRPPRSRHSVFDRHGLDALFSTSTVSTLGFQPPRSRRSIFDLQGLDTRFSTSTVSTLRFRPPRSRRSVFDLHGLDARFSTSKVSTLDFRPPRSRHSVFDLHGLDTQFSTSTVSTLGFRPPPARRSVFDLHGLDTRFSTSTVSTLGFRPPRSRRSVFDLSGRLTSGVRLQWQVIRFFPLLTNLSIFDPDIRSFNFRPSWSFGFRSRDLKAHLEDISVVIQWSFNFLCSILVASGRKRLEEAFHSWIELCLLDQTLIIVLKMSTPQILFLKINFKNLFRILANKSGALQHVRAVKRKREEVGITGRMPVIRFRAEDAEGILLPHNDALLITTEVAGFDVKRVFIDTGSS
ncbi:Unknown protein, partial [Striga hermonthica]